jgi:hypothetical protein
MEVNGQLHAPASLPPDNGPQYPLNMKFIGPQGRSGRGGEEEKSHHSLCRLITGLPARSVVTVLTELPRLFL